MSPIRTLLISAFATQNGSDVGERLIGGIGDDSLLGLGGDDILEGGDGNDVLEGGEGNDRLWGNRGADTLVGGVGDDELNGAHAGGFEVDDGSDLLDGGDGNDRLWGENADDTLEGGAGSDLLIGDVGNDSIGGGSGDDRIWAGAGRDTVAAGEGDDEVYGANGGGPEIPDDDDWIAGGEGSDRIFGESGSDTLRGGPGDDLLDGGSGLDTLDLSDAQMPLRVSLRSGAALSDEIGSDVVMSVERVIAGAAGDVLESLDSGSHLVGEGGDDTLIGLGGVDTLEGGPGNDVLRGGGERDWLDGGKGFDTASYADSPHGVRISLTSGSSSSDTLISIENIAGSAFADSLTGSRFANDLDGGAGNDTLAGGDGADTLRGGSGDDVYTVESLSDRVEELPGDGTDTIQSLISWRLQDTDGTGTLGDQVENLVLLGTSSINGSGNALANRLVGNSAGNALSGLGGNDTLVGAQGADTLAGAMGNDSLSGGMGADRLIGGINNDVLTGGDGKDTFVFAAGLLGNVDRITDFVSGADSIELDDAIFGGFTTGVAVTVDQLLIRPKGFMAKTPEQMLIYDQSTGRLYYDADGSGSAFTSTLFAILAGAPVIAAEDFIIN